MSFSLFFKKIKLRMSLCLKVSDNSKTQLSVVLECKIKEEIIFG